LSSRVPRCLAPLLYQGEKRLENYFEGWYFKQVAPPAARARSAIDKGLGFTGGRAFAFIPGISRGVEADTAFIQTIDGTDGITDWFPFPISAFSWQDEPFGLRIGANTFSLEGIHVDMENGRMHIKAELKYRNPTFLRSSLLSPGIMGPYSFAPFMECYHGVGSLDHETSGWIEIEDLAAGNPVSRIVFDGGRGYLEKDWGSSMPSAWVWMQTNIFDGLPPPASFMLSLARVPWLGGSFPGFICTLLINDEEYRFATYTGARLDLLEAEGRTVRILLSDKTHKMEILARRSTEGYLAAPVHGNMSRRIAESSDTELRVILKKRSRGAEDVIFDAYSTVGGMEMVGDIDSLRS